MLSRLLAFIRSLFASAPVHLAIVRRYQDAQGHNVGELYMEQEQNGVKSYRMIGASLDSFPLDLVALYQGADEWLDTERDFLAPMPIDTVRVGALDPRQNDDVRAMIARLPRRAMQVVVQNRFIEYVLERPVCEEKWPNE